MKQKLYIETSIVSYLVARPSHNVIVAAHQLATVVLWQRLDDYKVYVSVIVFQESSKGDNNQAQLGIQALEPLLVLPVDDEAKELARELIHAKVIPNKCPVDALHIAVAVVNGMDIIVTWNFKHINNPTTRKMIRDIVEKRGWLCPELCSPEELLGDEV